MRENPYHPVGSSIARSCPDPLIAIRRIFGLRHQLSCHPKPSVTSRLPAFDPGYSARNARFVQRLRPFSTARLPSRPAIGTPLRMLNFIERRDSVTCPSSRTVDFSPRPRRPTPRPFHNSPGQSGGQSRARSPTTLENIRAKRQDRLLRRSP